MLKKDQRGQISVEFVLILAIMAIIVAGIGWYVGNSNEESVISSAVRSAADNATTALVLNNSINPVRVEEISTTYNGTNIALELHFSSPINNQTSIAISNSILNSIASQGYKVINNSIVTKGHTYTVNVDNN